MPSRRRPIQKDTVLTALILLLSGLKRCTLTALMATFAASQSSTSQNPPTNLAPSSPPDPSIYTLHNGRQDPMPMPPINGNSHVQQQQSSDSKANGNAAGLGNGQGGMPVPNGLQHHTPNGGSRHRGTVSMGAFDGPRSPPNTKSMLHRCGRGRLGKKLTRPCRYLTCALQVFQNRPMSSWEGLSILTLN